MVAHFSVASSLYLDKRRRVDPGELAEDLSLIELLTHLSFAGAWLAVEQDVTGSDELRDFALQLALAVFIPDCQTYLALGFFLRNYIFVELFECLAGGHIDDWFVDRFDGLVDLVVAESGRVEEIWLS